MVVEGGRSYSGRRWSKVVQGVESEVVEATVATVPYPVRLRVADLNNKNPITTYYVLQRMYHSAPYRVCSTEWMSCLFGSSGHGAWWGQ